MPEGKKLTRFLGSVVRVVRKCFAIGSVIFLGNLFAVDALRGVDEVCGYRRVLLIIGTHEAHPRAMSGVSAPDALKANAAVVKAPGDCNGPTPQETTAHCNCTTGAPGSARHPAQRPPPVTGGLRDSVDPARQMRDSLV
jgi:hypothetical protein